MVEYKSPAVAYVCKECNTRVKPDHWGIAGVCPNCTGIEYVVLTDADLKVEMLEREVRELREQLERANFGGAIRYGIPY